MDLEGLNAHTKVQTVWHNNAQHRLVTSAYNPGVRSALVVPLRTPNVLGAGAAASGGEERAELEAQIQTSEQARAFAGSPRSACSAAPGGAEGSVGSERADSAADLAWGLVSAGCPRPLVWGSADLVIHRC